jgi:hypothetical protein
LEYTGEDTGRTDTDPAGTYEEILENTRNIPADNAKNFDKNWETRQNHIKNQAVTKISKICGPKCPKFHVMLCHIMRNPVTSYHITSHHVMSCQIMSHHITSHHIKSHHNPPANFVNPMQEILWAPCCPVFHHIEPLASFVNHPCISFPLRAPTPPTRHPCNTIRLFLVHHTLSCDNAAQPLSPTPNPRAFFCDPRHLLALPYDLCAKVLVFLLPHALDGDFFPYLCIYHPIECEIQRIAVRRMDHLPQKLRQFFTILFHFLVTGPMPRIVVNYANFAFALCGGQPPPHRFHHFPIEGVFAVGIS